MRRIIATAVLSLAASSSWVAVAIPPAAANVDTGAESGFVSATNSLRASHGLGPLEVSGELTAKARAWAQHMANGGCGGSICHSNLSDGVSSNWRRLGENVGKGPAVDAIHNAFVNSPGHYANLIDPGFRLVGVGVLNINGTLWVAEVFMEPASQPAPSSPAPAAGTPSSPGGAGPATTAGAPAAPAPPPPPPPPPVELTTNLDRLRLLERG